MTDSELEIVFELMGVRLLRGGYNRQTSCPLAPWTHSKGQDKNPSGSAKNGNPAVYQCFSCRNGGTIRKIAKLYAQYSGDSRAYEYIRKIEPTSLKDKLVMTGSYEDQKKKLIKPSKKKIDKSSRNIWDESDYEYLHQGIPFYVKERGMTKQQCIDFEIGFDPDQNRMIFVVRDYHKNLIGYSGRALSDEMKPKYKHYPGLTKESVLYGEDKINRDIKRAYLVEGFFDVIFLHSRGVPNVLATMGTSLSDFQITKLKRWFNEIVFIPDGDIEGLKFAEEYARKLLIKMPKVGIGCVNKNESYTKRKKPNAWEPCDYRYKLYDDFMGKDPSDLDGEYLQNVLKNIEWVDLTEMSE